MINKKKYFKIPFTIFVCSGLSIVLVFSADSHAQNGLGPENRDENGTAFPEPFSYEEYSVTSIPFPLLKMSMEQDSYALLVDKSRQELLLYKYDGNYHRVKTYDCTSGSNIGNKQMNGDRKTPEGMYYFTDVWEESDLIAQYGSVVAAQYGIRAFNTNYPNKIDLIKSKNGNGIWLHATDQPERISKSYDTKGCIVVRNSDIDEITRFITLYQTPIIIVKELEYYSENTIISEYQRVMDFLDTWRRSWEQRDFATYELIYSPEFNSNAKNFRQWISHKKMALRRYKWVRITFTNIRMYKTDEYYFVEFFQRFQSDGFHDEGIKRLYIVDNYGSLKIINEQWNAVEPESNLIQEGKDLKH